MIEVMIYLNVLWDQIQLALQFQILDEQKHVNTRDMNKQNETPEKLDITIVLPSVETDDYNSSESEWEEEAEKLCSWSKQLHIDALETPAFI